MRPKPCCEKESFYSYLLYPIVMFSAAGMLIKLFHCTRNKLPFESCVGRTRKIRNLALRRHGWSLGKTKLSQMLCDHVQYVSKNSFDAWSFPSNPFENSGEGEPNECRQAHWKTWQTAINRESESAKGGFRAGSRPALYKSFWNMLTCCELLWICHAERVIKNLPHLQFKSD